MPKLTTKAMVYDPKARTQRGVEVEITAPQFVIDAMEQGGLTVEMAAQEAFDSLGKRYTVEVRLVQKDRDGKRRR